MLQILNLCLMNDYELISRDKILLTQTQVLFLSFFQAPELWPTLG